MREDGDVGDVEVGEQSWDGFQEDGDLWEMGTSVEAPKLGLACLLSVS